MVKLLEEAQAQIKVAKCQIAVKTITFLGLTLDASGWKIHDKFLKSVAKAEKPENLTSLRSFIGLCNWQRRFIRNYVEVMAPLLELLKKDKEVKRDWREEHTRSFETIKEAFVSAPLLHHPRFDRPFTIFSDASEVAIGAVLCQKGRSWRIQSAGILLTQTKQC